MNYFLLALQYLPYVLNGVVAVEGALHGQPGATKKQAVLTAVTAATAVGEKVPEAHVALVSHLIDQTVTMLNTSGVFTKGTKA
jgi:hypothetical protein